MRELKPAALAGCCLLSLACGPGAASLAPDKVAPVSPVVSALTVTDGVPLMAPGTAVTERGFGGAVALSGNTLLVATGYMEISVTGDPGYVGPVFVFVRSAAGWTEQARLSPAAYGYRSWYGTAVAISGDRAIVGSHGLDNFKGAAYVFARTGGTWSLEATLLPDPFAFEFGISVAIEGDLAVVGTAGGKAYVFARESGQWSKKTVLTPSRIQGVPLLFGKHVALDGRLIAVAAPDDEVDGKANAGAVYLFEDAAATNTFTEIKRIVAGDPLTADNFGGAVALSRGRLAVGAAFIENGFEPPHVGPENLGRAYVFDRTATGNDGGWKQTARIDNPSTAVARFGASLSLQDDLLLIGAPYDGNYGGASYLYRASPSGWQLVKKLPGGPPAGPPGTFEFAKADALGRVFLDSLTAVVAGNAWKIPSGPGQVRIHDIRRDNGEACVVAVECGSGACVDGVCCNGACGAGASDCQACSLAAGGTQDGLCTPLAPARAAGITCRAATGACDPAEVCAPDATACPADRFAVDGASCTDGKACNGLELCAAGKCVPGTTLACPDDNDACTVASCADDVGCWQKQLANCPADAGLPASADGGATADAPAISVDANRTPDAGPDQSVEATPVVPAPPGADAGSADAADAPPVSDGGTDTGSSAQDHAPSCDCHLGGRTNAAAQPHLVLALAALAMIGIVRRRGRRASQVKRDARQ